MKEELDELRDLLTSFEEKALIEEGKKMSKLLMKHGIKIREHQYTSQ